MVATDSYIVATAMPTIVADLGGFRLFSWAFAAYLLAQAVTIPIYGRLADLYGRKRVFFAGTERVSARLACCAAAPGAWCRWCCSGRCKGSAPAPSSRSRRRSSATSIRRSSGRGCRATSPACSASPRSSARRLGAFVVEHVSWSLVFWVNLPIGAATFVMFGLFLHEHREPRRHRIDYLGSALLMLGVGAPMLALVQVGNADGADPRGAGGWRARLLWRRWRCTRGARRSRCCR